MTDIRASRMLPPDVEPVHVHEDRAGFALGILVGAALAAFSAIAALAILWGAR